MRIPSISFLVFKESLARNILGIHVFYAMALVLMLSFAQSAPDAFARRDLFIDGGVTCLFLFSLFLGLTITFPMVPSDLLQNRLLVYLSTYVSREQYILQKALGVLLTLAFNHALLCALLGASVWMVYSAHPSWLCKIYMATYLETLTLSAVTLFFSVALRRFMALMSVAFVFLVGHFTYYLEFYISQLQSQVAGKVIRALYLMLPNFEVFGVKNAFLASKTIPEGYFIGLFVYASGWIAIFIMATILIFQRREF